MMNWTNLTAFWAAGGDVAVWISGRAYVFERYHCRLVNRPLQTIRSQ